MFLPDNIRDFRFFVAVYEERSFTAAAIRQNATQSGVSQHIRKIEERLGTNLFVRESGAVVPTPAGDMFYSTCIDLLRSLDGARQHLEAFGGEVSGQITVGVTPTIARSVLSPALQRFLADFPNVNVKVVESYSAAVIEQVKSGFFDFGVVPALASAAGIRSHLIARTMEVLVSSAETEGRASGPVSIRTLPPLKIVLPSQAQARRGTLDRYLALSQASIERVIEIDSMFTTLGLVAHSDWISILPSLMVVDLSLPIYRINPLVDKELWLEVFLVEAAQKPISGVAQSLYDYIDHEMQSVLRTVSSKLLMPH